MTVRWLPRSEWGGGPVRAGHQVDPSQFVGLAVHHTVMVMADYDRDRYLHGDLDDIKRYMRQLQQARPDLGNEVPYSFVVFRGADPADCVVAEGRGRGRTGAHTIGYNSTRYGVAYAGNAEIDAITEGVVDGIRWVGATQLTHPDRAAATFGHRDVYPTACPGTNLYTRLPQPPFTTRPDTSGEFTVDPEARAEFDALKKAHHDTRKLLATLIEREHRTTRRTVWNGVRRVVDVVEAVTGRRVAGRDNDRQPVELEDS